MARELKGYGQALKAAYDQINKMVDERKGGLEAMRLRNPNAVQECAYNVSVYPPENTNGEADQEIESVLMKIEDLRNDVQNTTVFKQEIFNRIDCNLKRIESMKNDRVMKKKTR